MQVEQFQRIGETDEDIRRANKYTIFPNQILAHEEIIKASLINPYTTLIAQMQSGKTDTFLLTAFEFLRNEMVNQVIIFSGNNDTTLKDQMLANISEFRHKYVAHLQNILSQPWREANDIYDNCVIRIKVLWPSQLSNIVNKKQSTAKKTITKLENTPTLYIWEESHYAQSIGMIPSMFLNMFHLSPAGDVESYTKRNNYFLSVSATPFSEIQNIIQHRQQKNIVYLKPADSYTGIQNFIKNEQIYEHTGTIDDMYSAMETSEQKFGETPKYGIVRAVKSEKYAEIILLKGWDIKYYNMEIRDVENTRLAEQPERNTILFIKGAMRMGQQVDKTHIGFCFEDAESSNTDTILQSLIGRMCGFSPNIKHICIYIHQNILQKHDIDKYSEFMNEMALGSEHIIDAGKFCPTNAMNCVSVPPPPTLEDKINSMKTRREKEYHCSPIYIPVKYMTKEFIRNKNITDIETILHNPESYPEIINRNSNEQTVNIRKRFSEALTKGEIMSFHLLSKKTNQTIFTKLVQAISNNSYFNSGASSDRIHIWEVDVASSRGGNDYSVGDLFIEIKTDILNTEFAPCMRGRPKTAITTAREVFYHSIIETNMIIEAKTTELIK